MYPLMSDLTSTLRFYLSHISFYIYFFLFRLMNILAGGLSLLVLGINFYFAAVYIQNLAIKHWALYTFIALVMIAYVAFILYLVSI